MIFVSGWICSYSFLRIIFLATDLATFGWMKRGKAPFFQCFRDCCPGFKSPHRYEQMARGSLHDKGLRAFFLLSFANSHRNCICNEFCSKIIVGETLVKAFPARNSPKEILQEVYEYGDWRNRG